MSRPLVTYQRNNKCTHLLLLPCALLMRVIQTQTLLSPQSPATSRGIINSRIRTAISICKMYSKVTSHQLPVFSGSAQPSPDEMLARRLRVPRKSATERRTDWWVICISEFIQLIKFAGQIKETTCWTSCDLIFYVLPAGSPVVSNNV